MMNGEIQGVVATNKLSRGQDIPEVDHVNILEYMYLHPGSLMFGTSPFTLAQIWIMPLGTKVVDVIGLIVLLLITSQFILMLLLNKITIFKAQVQYFANNFFPRISALFQLEKQAILFEVCHCAAV